MAREFFLDEQDLSLNNQYHEGWLYSIEDGTKRGLVNLRFIEYSAYEELKSEVKRLHDKYDFQILCQERDRLKAALEFNKREWELIRPDSYKHLVAWQKADAALAGDTQQTTKEESK